MHLKSHAGDHAAAARCGDQALAAYGRAGFALGTVAVQRELARWSMRCGDSRAATQLFQALFGGWQREQMHLNRDIAWAQMMAAEHYFLQNELAQACVHQAAAHALAQQLQDDELVFLTTRMGQVYAAVQAASAVTCLPAAQAAEHIRTTAIVNAFLELETRWLVASGQAAAAWPLIQQFDLTFSHSKEDYLSRNLIPYLRAWMARGEALAEIGEFLAGAEARFAATGERLRQLQLLALTAWQELQLYGPDRAAGTLTEAARLAAETGYIRVLLDIPALAAHLAAGRAGDEGVPAVQAVARNPLTEQEQAVLALLADERTYPEIARELVISVNTVRTHMRHIYEKLAVHRRDQAIAAARRRGLLSR